MHLLNYTQIFIALFFHKLYKDVSLQHNSHHLYKLAVFHRLIQIRKQSNKNFDIKNAQKKERVTL